MKTKTFLDAVRALASESERLEKSAEWQLRDKAVALQRARSFLLSLVTKEKKNGTS